MKTPVKKSKLTATNVTKAETENQNHWRKTGTLGNLFVLWTDGRKWTVWLHPALEARRKHLSRGHREDPEKTPRSLKLEAAFERIAVTARNPSQWENEFAEATFSFMIEGLGIPLAEVFFGSEASAKNAGTFCEKIFSAAIDGLIQDRFPTKQNGERAERTGEIDSAAVLNARFFSNEPIGKKAREAIQRVNWALAAIESARQLAEETGKLPRKADVIARLEGGGLVFSNKSKDKKGKWSDIFKRAGLEELPS